MKRMMTALLFLGFMLVFMPARGEQPVVMSIPAREFKRGDKDDNIEYPNLVDNAGKNWATWDNRIWPCTYLIDKKGNVRYRWDSELNFNGVKGHEIMREKSEELLAEKE